MEPAAKVLRRWNSAPPPGMLPSVIRILHMVLLLVFLGPQVGPILSFPDPYCEDTGEACAPDEACTTACAMCACCVTRLSTAVTVAEFEPLNPPVDEACTAAVAVPPSPPPADILHVPKSPTR